MMIGIRFIKAVLELQFYDVEEGSTGCITEQQAEKIAGFILQVRVQVERIIVHCEYGQSRSAGIMGAIRDYFDGNDGGEIWGNPDYHPNITCYKYLLAALNKLNGLEKMKNGGFEI